MTREMAKDLYIHYITYEDGYTQRIRDLEAQKELHALAASMILEAYVADMFFLIHGIEEEDLRSDVKHFLLDDDPEIQSVKK